MMTSLKAGGLRDSCSCRRRRAAHTEDTIERFVCKLRQFLMLLLRRRQGGIFGDLFKTGTLSLSLLILCSWMLISNQIGSSDGRLVAMPNRTIQTECSSCSNAVNNFNVLISHWERMKKLKESRTLLHRTTSARSYPKKDGLMHETRVCLSTLHA